MIIIINIKKYIDERLPEEYEKCMVGLTAILREAWTTSQKTEDKREKIQALSLAKECYSMKLDAIRFVCGKSSYSRNEDVKEPKEPDYKDKDNLVEKQQDEEKLKQTVAY